MDKKALRDFSVFARTELINQVEVKINNFGIFKDKNGELKIGEDFVLISGKQYPKGYEKSYKKLIAEQDRIGYEMLIEQVAYTWFNRFIALRYMEINDYLPSHIRVLSSEVEGKSEPDIIKYYNESGLDIDTVEIESLLRDKKEEEAFKKLLIAQCNELSTMLPFLFEKINDYTEMLLPDNLLSPTSVLSKLVSDLGEDNFTDVEVVGWLYQYYISEKKDEVIKAKKKYKKEEIPFATQLFTPDWIVRYMVQNSLGRYWIESHPEHEDLKKEWEFYLENPNPEPDFEEKLTPYINKELRVEHIKCFDPACGSGHILVYMFDVLYQIYEKCGYMSKNIPKLIIENNLYGLDIDDRAYQLACFSIIMKGMQYNNRLLRNIEREAEKTEEEGIKLNIASIQETNEFNNDDIIYLAGESLGENYEKTKSFIKHFNNSKIYGSLINIDEFDVKFFNNRLQYIKRNPGRDLFEHKSREKIEQKLDNLIKQAEIMVNVYDVIVTNPPYLSNKYMNTELKEFINKLYTEVNTDLFAAFVSFSMCKIIQNGQIGFITPYVWMYLSSYESLRKNLITNKNITSLVQLEYNAFEVACVPVCTFTLRNYNSNTKGEYIRLSDFKGSENQSIKLLEAINNNVNYRFSIESEKFALIPEYTIAYQASDKILSLFNKCTSLGELYNIKKGIDTGENDVFVRFWFEVNKDNIFLEFNKHSKDIYNFKWYPYLKGGKARKWYGNFDFIVDYENNGSRIKQHKKSTIRNEQYNFRKGITWSDITTNYFSARFFPEGFIRDNRGPAIFGTKDNLYIILSFLCSKLSMVFQDAINQTMCFQVGNLKQLPVVESLFSHRELEVLAKENIEISRSEWDSFEVSWDFRRNPLLNFNESKKTIREAFEEWKILSENRFNQIKHNEEKINEIIIESYGLSCELSAEVNKEEITITMADKLRDIKSFISYAVGCILGRYSLDQEGIVFAGGKFDLSKYTTFKADKDNIMPILQDSYFEYDIVDRFSEFVKVTFGEDTISENLDFIAETLGKKEDESSKDTIRRYFLNEFYNDHVQTYKKRPIYWLIVSGKLKAFSCLIYLHRYNSETLATIRLSYLHELQVKYANEEKQILRLLDNPSLTTAERKKMNKKLQLLKQMQNELLVFDKTLAELASEKIELDLDDGVVENYKKLQPILAKIK
ncbi:BREX-1 system adenine-specific DNA-methyltransferase PglX [Clostridium sp. DJ247]|uniref:BREX-1 system adenine-specific DNA-methyltransferase PglX n=1 Tax=Clostridium sp. DJ247 TaxID=2726188 RepID=UPI00162A8892|nr:BREX-1 system adenine-specific DNA-methyltransferase PglX [Clostridium sp. DJ247]MBC2579371.1 BREX-1 system adenine-specific DNA-methyltransferase PglX [Clostridium sp. DJ247]